MCKTNMLNMLQVLCPNNYKCFKLGDLNAQTSLVVFYNCKQIKHV